MSTSYEKLYEKLLPKFRNYDLPFLTEKEVKEQLVDYITPAISRFHVCLKDLTDKDDSKEIFNEDLTDMELEILSNFMLLEYIDSNYIRVPSILKANLYSSDFSSANHLDKLMNMHDAFRRETETLLSRYSWVRHSPKENDSIEKLKSTISKVKSLE